jgi:hypothetical protein
MLCGELPLPNSRRLANSARVLVVLVLCLTISVDLVLLSSGAAGLAGEIAALPKSKFAVLSVAEMPRSR